MEMELNQTLAAAKESAGGGAELFVDGESGLVFKSEDTQDFSRKLEMLLGNPERMREMGMCAVQRCIQKYKIFNTIDLIKNNQF